MGPPHARDLGLARCRGYTFARGVDLHGDEINLPRRFFFVYVVVVVLSSGVLWELFAFLLDAVAARTAITMPLAQFGLDDTVRDLLFNSVGALAVAAFGQAHLSEALETVRRELSADE